MLGNQYGHFSDSGRSFTITDPATPMPWVNVVCNGRYGFVVSQNGGGFSWLDNSQLNVLTRWDMDLVRDQYGRFLYAADLDTGEVWSLAPTPCRPAYDAYSCEHAAGLTTFTTECHGVRAVWTLAVAPHDTAEVWRVELTNLRPRARRMRISSFFEWCCGVAPDTKREFHRLFFTTEYDRARGTVFANKNMWDVPARHEAEHWNRPWPYVAAHAVCGVSFEAPLALGDKTAFVGRYGQTARPAAMNGANVGVGTFGRFGDAAAALGGDFTLPASGSVTVGYVVAIAENREAVAAIVDRLSSVRAVEAAIASARSGWVERLAPTHVKTAKPDFDLLNNHWLPYQAISGRLWGRTGYYQQSGAFGFRDQLQDSLVWLNLDPARTREQIRLHARHQFADGSVFHWWHPLTETGLRTACSDDYLWLGYITAQYLKDTGDLKILDEREPFFDHAAPSTILDHIERAIARSFSRLSPRGIPLIGSCDWNDGLSALGVGGKGESVWLSWFLASILEDFAAVYAARGEQAKASDFRDKRARLVEAANAHAWDGEHFRYGTRDDGEWIGSSKNAEGKIHLNAQTWAILADSTTPERAKAAWGSVKRHLLTDFGPLLLAPAYTVPDLKIGYITRYAPGTRENGGVYMHAATWALAAAAKMKDADAVGAIWRSISPPTRGANAEAYRAEPYVVPGNVDGPLSDLPGRAGWTWYTGSAQWLRRVSLEWVLGARPTFEGLVIDPCTPPEWGKVELTRLYRGCRVTVKFDAAACRPGVRPAVSVDGKNIEGNVIAPSVLEGKSAATVEVGWPGAAGAKPGGAVVELKREPDRGVRAPAR